MILRNITSSEPGDEFDQKRAEGFVFGDLAVGSQLLQEPRGGLRIGFEGRGFWRVDPTKHERKLHACALHCNPTRGNIEVKLQLYDQQVNKPSSKPLSRAPRSQAHSKLFGRRFA